jgi:hypothetical protein
MQVVELDVAVDQRFYCPVTGQLILAPEEYTPSPATAFVLPPEAEDFDAMLPGLRKIWDKVRATPGEENAMPWQLFESFCKELEQHTNLVLFNLTTHGMACGPVSDSVRLCIDFAYGAGEYDEEEDTGR